MEQLELFGDEAIAGIAYEKKQDENIADFNSIVLKSSVSQDEYTNYIEQAFDLNITDTCKVCIPNNLKLESLDGWNIGVICGASGSGKSTILRHIAQKSGGGNFQSVL